MASQACPGKKAPSAFDNLLEKGVGSSPNLQHLGNDSKPLPFLPSVPESPADCPREKCYCL